MNVKCGCNIPYTLVCTAVRGEQYWDFYQCPQCGTPTHTIRYIYHPSNCIGHQWEFIGTKFVDKQDHHEILQLLRCSRCGKIREIERSTEKAGLVGRIEVEDPRVQQTLLLNRSAFERMAPKEIVELQTTPLPYEVFLPREEDL